MKLTLEETKAFNRHMKALHEELGDKGLLFATQLFVSSRTAQVYAEFLSGEDIRIMDLKKRLPEATVYNAGKRLRRLRLIKLQSKDHSRKGLGGKPGPLPGIWRLRE